MRFAGLDSTGMHRIRLTHEPLGPIDLADWSGIILGGGPYNVSDVPESKSTTQQRVESELFALIGRIVDEDYPFLGCCYGVGTVGTVIGAVIDRSYPEPVGGMSITVTDEGRDDPLFAEVPDVFDAYGGHKEAATTLPADAVCLATSPQCPVQAFRVRRERLRHAVPSRTRSRRHRHPRRRLQEPRLLRARVSGPVENRSAAVECPASTQHSPAVHRTVWQTTVTALGLLTFGNVLNRGNCRIRPRP